MLLNSKRANYFTDLTHLRSVPLPEKLLVRRGGKYWVAIPHHVYADTRRDRFALAVPMHQYYPALIQQHYHF